MSEKTMLALIKIYDDKLKELMSLEEYTDWARETARQTFKIEIEGMAPSEFKELVQQNLHTILGGE